jgi:hypothetical protein
MGYFSFLFCDTGKSIKIAPYKIYMKDNKRNTFIEHNYEGYGIIGGKDIYILFAEMNNLSVEGRAGESEEYYQDRLRSAAIEIWYHYDTDSYLFPNLLEYNTKWENKKPEIKMAKKIYMKDNRGNTFIENKYEGDGIFGGKDIYLLFAQMNNLSVEGTHIKEDFDMEDYNEEDPTCRLRDLAIEIWFANDTDSYIFPNLLEYNAEWTNKKPKDCPNQGW